MVLYPISNGLLFEKSELHRIAMCFYWKIYVDGMQKGIDRNTLSHPHNLNDNRA